MIGFSASSVTPRLATSRSASTQRGRNGSAPDPPSIRLVDLGCGGAVTPSDDIAALWNISVLTSKRP